MSLSSIVRTTLLAVFLCLYHCKISEAFTISTTSITAHFQINTQKQQRRAFQLNMDAVELGTEGYTTSADLDNPPFFPSTVEELAYDVAFTTKIALINRIKRIRVDVRMRLTSRDRYMLKWLLLTSINLLDDSDDDSNVHVFIDKTVDVMRCQEIWREIVNNSTMSAHTPTHHSTSTSSSTSTSDIHNAVVDIKDSDRINQEIKEKKDYLKKLNKIHISPISDVHLRDTDSILVIFNPDNMHTCEHPDLLEDVQALCFHAALRKIPVVLINPQLMATGTD